MCTEVPARKTKFDRDFVRPAHHRPLDQSGPVRGKKGEISIEDCFLKKTMHIVTTYIEGTDELRVIGQIFRVGQQSSQLQTMLDANDKNDSVAVAYGKIFTGEYYTYAGHPHVLRLAAGAR